jgi:hypothetical protein
MSSVFAYGCWVLVRLALHPFGGRLEDVWAYQSRDAHRFTAMSMLTGSLRYHHSLVSLVGDEEVYNGAGYTHWGYGVPLLQVPFHAAARHVASLPAKFFPDRAIFFVYLALLVPVLWMAMDRLVAMREGAPGRATLRRHVVSWAATAFVLCSGLYPMLTGHFHVYDETIAYFGVIELFAISAYVFVMRSSGWMPVAALAIAAGMGLLTRPTGAVFFGMWAVIAVLERPSRRTAFVFAGAAAPFVVFWLVTNWVRTGYPWSVGFQNSLPGADHIGHVRFGSLCINGWNDWKNVAHAIFGSLFWVIPENRPWMQTCGLKFEGPSGSDAGTGPYLGAGVEIFLVWTLLHYVARRERRLGLYLPHAAFAFVFVTYVNAGAGMAWRYIGDFWPLVSLIGVQYVRTLPVATSSLVGWPLAAVLLAGAYTSYKRDIEPAKKQFDAFDATAVPHMWKDFESTRTGQDKTLPSTLPCGLVPEWPRFNVFWRSNVIAWNHDCTVATVTELFLGVPPKSDDSYTFRMKTEGMAHPSVLVWVNGRLYTARKGGDTYQADVHIHYASLSSPTVFVSIEWQHDLLPVPGRLDEVSLQ